MYTFFIATVLVFSFFFHVGRGASTSPIVEDVKDIERLFLGEEKERYCEFLKDPKNWENNSRIRFLGIPMGPRPLFLKYINFLFPGPGLCFIQLDQR